MLRPMSVFDDDLKKFEAHGALSLANPDSDGYTDHDGVRIRYSTYGAGRPVIFLHGGLGHSGNWGYQVPALCAHGYRVILIDSRGHGRSTRDSRPYSYELMATDVLAVMDILRVESANIVGWSDGACTALLLGNQHPSRVNGVVFFACNMDPSGTKPFTPNPVLDRCLSRHRRDYAKLSATPDDFDSFCAAVGQMQRTQPDYSAEDVARICVPVLVLHAEFDEFIQQEHAEYLARTLPHAEFVLLSGVSHFAPLQRPEEFNRAVLRFLYITAWKD
jgi:pimeloyl-ACP methyl ester carboxylesterase